MKLANRKVNSAETEKTKADIKIVKTKVKDLRVGEVKEVDTAEYLINVSNYEILGD